MPCIYRVIFSFAALESKQRTRLLVWVKNPSVLCVLGSTAYRLPSTDLRVLGFIRYLGYLEYLEYLGYLEYLEYLELFP